MDVAPRLLLSLAMLLIGAFATTVQAQTQKQTAASSEPGLSQPWRVCVSDASVPPYLYNDPHQLGLAEHLLMDAARQVGLAAELLRYPSARCRAMMKADKLDALLAAPTVPNLTDFQFPEKAGAVDPGRRLARLKLVWVKRADSPFDWQNGEMLGASRTMLLVGTRAALTVASEPLSRLGFSIDMSARTTHQLLQKLAARRVDLALALQEEVELAMQDPQLQSLVVLPRALSSVDFYLAVQTRLPPERLAQVEAWWAAIGHLRDLPEYRPH